VLAQPGSTVAAAVASRAAPIWRREAWGDSRRWFTVVFSIW